MTLPRKILFTTFDASATGADAATVEATERYTVERVEPVCGAAVNGIEPGQSLWRIEAAQRPANPRALFTATTQHHAYTDSAVRTELVQMSLPRSGPIAVLIPICKSPRWWALARDERERLFARGAHPGHVAIGQAYAARIARRLYHGRYIPNSEWDFLTYFEFAPEHESAFRDLLAGLRDPAQNPEWSFVDRETEIWMRREGVESSR